MKDSWSNPLFYRVTLMVSFFEVQDSGINYKGLCLLAEELRLNRWWHLYPRFNFFTKEPGIVTPTLTS
jgi:hypothetical protein